MLHACQAGNRLARDFFGGVLSGQNLIHACCGSRPILSTLHERCVLLTLPTLGIHIPTIRPIRAFRLWCLFLVACFQQDSDSNMAE